MGPFPVAPESFLLRVLCSRAWIWAGPKTLSIIKGFVLLSLDLGWAKNP